MRVKYLFKFKPHLLNNLTSKCWCQLPNFYGAKRCKLSQAEFHVVKRFADEDKNYDVRYEESSSAVFISNEREPPNVTESHRHSNARQQELDWVTPLLTAASSILKKKKNILIICKSYQIYLACVNNYCLIILKMMYQTHFEN